MDAPVPSPHKASPAATMVYPVARWTWLSTPSPATSSASPAATVSLVPAARAMVLAAPPATSSPAIIGSSRRPALMGSLPSTLCRYCGTVNRIPNSGTDTPTAPPVPQGNRRRPPRAGREGGGQGRQAGRERPGARWRPAGLGAVDDAPDQAGDRSGGQQRA